MRYNIGMSSQPINRREFLRLSGLFLSGALLAACNQAVESGENENDAPLISTDLPESPAFQTEETTPTVNVLASGLDFPEGPAFDPEGNLWCTELLGGNLVRLEGEKIVRYPTGGRPNGLAFDRKGRAWVCDSGQNAIRRFDPATDVWETLVDSLDGDPLQSPNDLCFDASGNLLFTCPNFADTSPTGYVCCLTPDGKLSRIVEGFYRPNGLDIVDGGDALVVADTYRKVLVKGAWVGGGQSGTQTWKDPVEWVEVGGREGPDGMVPGKDGLLYAAIYGDGVLRVIDAEGQIISEYNLPGANPTNAAVDPSGKLGLVVTETENGQLLSLPEIQPGVAIFDGGEAWQ